MEPENATTGEAVIRRQVTDLTCLQGKLDLFLSPTIEQGLEWDPRECLAGGETLPG